MFLKVKVCVCTFVWYGTSCIVSPWSISYRPRLGPVLIVYRPIHLERYLSCLPQLSYKYFCMVAKDMVILQVLR